MGRYSVAFRDKQVVNDELRKQNEAIQTQVNKLQDKMKEVKTQIKIQPRKQVVKKKCDHMPLINQLESSLKEREIEFKANKAELDGSLREKERQLASTISAIKQHRNHVELLRQQKVNTESSAIGYEKMNELVAKLRELQTEQEHLKTDVKSYQRINSLQNQELEQIDAVKNYQGKVQQLTKDLRLINRANRELAEQINEVNKTKKQLRAQETKLEDRQRDVVTRQKLLQSSANKQISRNGAGSSRGAAGTYDHYDPYMKRKHEIGLLS